MRRLAALAASAAVLMITAAPASAQRTDDASKPVVFLSGGESSTIDCNAYWGRLIPHLRQMKLRSKGQDLKFTGEFIKVTSYSEDKNCDVKLGNGASMDIGSQARAFATWLKTQPKPVDIVAFGTGGLVARYALAAQGTTDWPSGLPVEDVVTLGTPHGGSPEIAKACPGRIACQDMDPASGNGKALFARLAEPKYMSPPGDWTAIAAAGDELVKPESALAMDAAHETTYTDAKLTHLKLLTDTSKAYDATVTYQHPGTEVIEWRKAPHVAQRVGLNLVFGSTGNLSAPNTSGCSGSNDQTGGAVIVRFPGMVGWKGNQDMSYIRSGILEAYTNCFKKEGEKFTSEGVVRVNGIDLTPVEGSKITIDPAKREVKGLVSVSLPSAYFGAYAVPLMQEHAVDWLLPKEAGALKGSDLDGFSVSGGGKIAGLKLKGSAKVSFGQGTVNLETSLALPGLFGGSLPTGKAFTQKPQCNDGEDNDEDGKVDSKDDNCATPQDNYEDSADNPSFAVSIKSDNVTGLQLDKISGTVEGNLRLGKFQLPSLSLAYSLPDNTWSASVSVVVPLPNAPKVTVAGAIKDGKLAALSGEATGLQAGPGPFNLYLQRIKVGWVRDPFEFTLGTGISWDRRYTFPNYGTFAATEVEGDMTFTDTNFKLAGKLLLFGIEWGSGSADIKYGTGVNLNMVIGRSFDVEKDWGKVKAKLKASLQGTFTGAIDSSGVDLSATGGACFEGELEFGPWKREQDKTCLGQATVRGTVKKKVMAFTVCGQADLGVWSGAIGYGIRSSVNAQGKTEEKADVVMDSCDVDSWHADPASASQAGGAPSVSVDKGVPAEIIGIEGEGAPPHVALDGPDGASIPAPASASGVVKGKGYMLIHSTADNTTYVVIGKPAAGRWTVEPQPGSAPLGEVRAADALPAVDVKGSLRGGRFTYAVARQPGQVVHFKEVIPGAGTKLLRTVTGGTGALKFTPSFGPGGKRRIVAVVEQDGRPRTELTVATFKARAPETLAAPRSVKLARRGARMTVTWPRVAGAVRYAVGVKTGDGRSMLFETKTRRVVVKRMLGDRASKVAVRAVRVDNQLGKARTVRGGR